MYKALLFSIIVFGLTGCVEIMTPDEVGKLEEVCKKRGFKPVIKAVYYNGIGEMPVSVRCHDEERGLVYFALDIENE